MKIQRNKKNLESLLEHGQFSFGVNVGEKWDVIGNTKKIKENGSQADQFGSPAKPCCSIASP